MASDEKKKKDSWHISVSPETNKLDNVLVDYFSKEDPFYPYPKTTRIKHFLYNTIIKEKEKEKSNDEIKNISERLDKIEETNKEILNLLKMTTNIKSSDNNIEDEKLKEIKEMDNIIDNL